MIAAIPPALRRLRRDERGVAMIEFAFTLPIMTTLLLYGIETANLGLTLLRIHQVAATSADNVARVRDSINESDVNEVLMGGRIVGGGDFMDRGRIVVSDVVPNGQPDTLAGQTILWQRCTGKLKVNKSKPQYGVEGDGKDDATLQWMGKNSRKISARAGSAMIFVEVTYKYKPVITETFLGEPLLRSESSFTVRERNSEALGAGASGTVASTCSRYDV